VFIKTDIFNHGYAKSQAVTYDTFTKLPRMRKKIFYYYKILMLSRR
jgi:hypothetical protein